MNSPAIVAAALLLAGGGSRHSIDNDLPTVAVHDKRVQEQANDPAIANHGRGYWVLDNINALEGLATDGVGVILDYRVAGGDGRPSAGGSRDGGAGDAPGAEAALTIELSIHAADGRRVRRVELPDDADAAGLHRVVSDLRYDPTWVASPGQGDGERGGGAGSRGGDRGTVEGPWVLPGTYEARLTIGGTTSARPVEVVADPLAAISDADRRFWHDTQVSLAHMLAAARAAAATGRLLDQELEQAKTSIEQGTAVRLMPDDVRERITRVSTDMNELLREIGEISDRAGSVYRQIQRVIAVPTTDQIRIAERSYARLKEKLEDLQWVVGQEMGVISGLLGGLGVPWSMGRPVTLPAAARPPVRR